MSNQLKSLLMDYGNYSARHYIHNPEVPDATIDETVEELQRLMLELIGEDETTIPSSYKECYKQDARIALRAELRRKVEEL